MAALPRCRSTLCWLPRGAAALWQWWPPWAPAGGQPPCVSAPPGSQRLLKPLLCSKLQSLMSQQISNEKHSSGNALACYPQKRHAMQLQLVKHHLQTTPAYFLCAHSSNHTKKGSPWAKGTRKWSRQTQLKISHFVWYCICNSPQVWEEHRRGCGPCQITLCRWNWYSEPAVTDWEESP